MIPKAASPESQRANLDALAVRLDHQDRSAIAALPKDQSFVRPPFAPDWDAAGCRPKSRPLQRTKDMRDWGSCNTSRARAPMMQHDLYAVTPAGE
ncbi:hypothetical protein [Xanthobacter oligotrophicus]|uniref:hypothetical protein n=1 Tax=Xanthobacter oligotrophicus TaxID=2607286 RepID=UPI00372D222F